jgi:hypothetical protein
MNTVGATSCLVVLRGTVLALHREVHRCCLCSTAQVGDAVD